MSAIFTSTFAPARSAATPASLTVALGHTIAYLLAPLESVYPSTTLTALAESLHASLTPRLAKHWSSPSRAARVISLSPASLPPKAILDAFAATGTNWQLAVHMRASGADFDLFVDPGCVSVSIAGGKHLTVWSEAPAPVVSGNKPSTHELLAFDDDDELFSLIDKQLLSSTRSSLSAPSGQDTTATLGHAQLSAMLSLFPTVPPTTSTAFPKCDTHLSAFHSRSTSTSSSVPSLSHSRSSSATSNASFGHAHTSFGPHSRSSSSSSLAEKNPHYNVNHPALLRLKARDQAKAQEGSYDFLPPRLSLPIPLPQSDSTASLFTPRTPPTASSPAYSTRTVPSPITPLSALSLSHSNSSSSSLESVEFAAVVIPATPIAPTGPKSAPLAVPVVSAGAKPKRSRRARVHVDSTRVTPTRYEGGRTTVLTGGTMLGPRSI